MSGVQIWNSAGALVIDSDYFGTYYRDNITTGAIVDQGYFSINSPIGDGTDMGFPSSRYSRDANLQWFKFNEGAKVFFGDDPYMTTNAGRIARTGYDVPLTSGYWDVYNGAGQLVWSVVSAAKVPRVLGFFDIPAGAALDGGVYSQYIGPDAWILSSHCPGNLSTDADMISGYSGLMFRYSGGTLQCTWINQNQYSWASTLQNYGLRIPYAIIPVLS
ncbi:hypothetical protein CYR55_05305 [Chimaeribacter californicus]|uniref:Uncharacterized protein n=1 Tax=Chimaeribacter californicus TaxID=2060067 RepID=A0A2N5EDS5_9GAMM|nr:hypothetical protein [Chimaeribacter californicus]PLR40698.1 hypothetical protein CYR55_05305 [Chimaeribacter californicus]